MGMLKESKSMWINRISSTKQVLAHIVEKQYVYLMITVLFFCRELGYILADITLLCGIHGVCPWYSIPTLPHFGSVEAFVAQQQGIA